MARSLTAASLAAVLMLSACQPADEPAPGVDEVSAEASLNTLTEQEQAEGWELLFNGQDFEGWRGFSGEEVPAVWTVEDGTLYYTGDSTKAGGDIMTQQVYDNFEFSLEYKISECGNSGIMYLVGEGDAPYHTGPEYQVLDNTCHPDAQNGLNRTAGANYDMHEPAVDASKPAGEWNQVRIVKQGNHIEHWLNGQKVVEYELGSDDWKQRVANSKWAEVSGYGSLDAGHIDLQDHDDPVWYRNIKIRPLNNEQLAS